MPILATWLGCDALCSRPSDRIPHMRRRATSGRMCTLLRMYLGDRRTLWEHSPGLQALVSRSVVSRSSFAEVAGGRLECTRAEKVQACVEASVLSGSRLSGCGAHELKLCIRSITKSPFKSKVYFYDTTLMLMLMFMSCLSNGAQVRHDGRRRAPGSHVDQQRRLAEGTY